MTAYVWWCFFPLNILKLTILISWTEFVKQRNFSSKTKTVNTTIEQVSFLDQICPKRASLVKNRKVHVTTEFCICELVLVPNFSLNWKFRCFGPTLATSRNWKKWTPQLNSAYWNRISLVTKFQLKLPIFMFWTKFIQKGYFRLKTEKVNMTIEFCILKLVTVLQLHFS